MTFPALFLSMFMVGNLPDTVISLPEVDVSASLKIDVPLRTLPVASSSFVLGDIETFKIEGIADFAAITPNLHIPDYGSKMTSSIYVRGIGSRIDNPSMGMYVDQMPVLNKNCYDVDLWDISRIDVLRGPQGTLYGRNSIGGIMSISTLSPLNYQGTRIKATYGNGNTRSATVSTYIKPRSDLGISVGANYRAVDGFFKNEYNGKKCDEERSGSARARLVWKPSDKLTFDNAFSFACSDEGGYAYALLDTAKNMVSSINYNDKCGYERVLISDGLTINYSGKNMKFSSVSGWQYLDDAMTLDQDFSPKSMFTMQQMQNEHTFNQEFLLKNTDHLDVWQWLFGASFFYKHNRMSAPVLFKHDGINELILDNANAGIHSAFPDANILFEEEEFFIYSDFVVPVWETALFHQSQYSLGNFLFTAGLRLDFEKTTLEYESSSLLHYRFSLTMNDFRPLQTRISGNEHRYFVVPMPKLSVQYMLPSGGNLYATVARGYKAGGFNTQMFSDILQNQMKSDLLGALGVYPDDKNSNYTIDDVIGYDPEYDWNYELGCHLGFFGDRMLADVATFYIDCRNQQLTVFPDGKTSGRMMTNAGRTCSFGAEAALQAKPIENLSIRASYGYTNAQFEDYNSGKDDYSGNFVPYVPQHMLAASAAYSLAFSGKSLDRLLLKIDYSGVGKIYWNETNTASQDFYSLLGASVGISKGKLGVDVWTKNLTNTNYGNFYFMSMGNSFLSKGKPFQCGVTLKILL